MAENILAAACESETRNAAKRMRLDIYQAHVSLCVCYVKAYLVLLYLDILSNTETNLNFDDYWLFSLKQLNVDLCPFFPLVRLVPGWDSFIRQV